MYQGRLAAHRAGYIPVLIQIENQANTAYGLPWEYGGDASAARGVYLQDKNNRDNFLREVGKTVRSCWGGVMLNGLEPG